MLQCHYWVATVPKKGSTEEENEDFYFADHSAESEGIPSVKFALSDGATESAFSGIWAEYLVINFEKHSFDKTLELAIADWNRETQKQELPWYLHNKILDGAHATFLGVELNLVEHQANVVAVGDTNFFQIRDNFLIKAFPVDEPSGFNNQPNLLASVTTQQTPLDEIKYESKNLALNAGDTLILATDALAHWLLIRCTKDNKPWSTLIEMTQSDDFEQQFVNWLMQTRQDKAIKNDDTTLIIIKLTDGLSKG
ncbi:SpoIIE family protein phosphatase [Rudanella paleaurantiibacter]|uniref:SpoIIE family protein phosphatase n=1 Tax=Rudanella paleaurantiibacter TaxID=2614655 RepID=A0A7J5U1Q9_9BACT|nr:SpoIIE family protein phosphatase [Rudanella paleaurantiibacter]KAB7731739.1 SpoIIE family protein phosphatase [Rudanella paleaurantiibacter]